MYIHFDGFCFGWLFLILIIQITQRNKTEMRIPSSVCTTYLRHWMMYPLIIVGLIEWWFDDYLIAYLIDFISWLLWKLCKNWKITSPHFAFARLCCLKIQAARPGLALRCSLLCLNHLCNIVANCPRCISMLAVKMQTRGFYIKLNWSKESDTIHTAYDTGFLGSVQKWACIWPKTHTSLFKCDATILLSIYANLYLSYSAIASFLTILFVSIVH